MLQLRVFGTAPVMAEVAACLQEIPGSRHVIRSGDGASNHALVTADLLEEAVDPALDRLRSFGVVSDDIALVRLDSIGPAVAQDQLATVVWTDLLTQAGANARPLARYLIFMAAGGTMTFVLHTLGLLPSGLEPGQTGFLAGLSTVNISTPIVAFAAGVAGMLALETRASSAVGVAISVTTIPASAYLGVAAAVGELSKAAGALLVLGVNVAMLLIGGCLTLLAQRGLARRTPWSAAGWSWPISWSACGAFPRGRSARP